MKILELWLLYLEGLWELVLSKARITLLPFRYWVWPRGRFQSESLWEDTTVQRPRILLVRRAVLLAARVTPWRSKCLDQALAVQRLLAHRGWGSTLYYGMARDQHMKWVAHAWVRCGNQWAIGYQSGVSYTVVGTCALIPANGARGVA